MTIDLSFWRFVIILRISKSLLWGKREDVFWFHIGTFSNDGNTALRIIILPFCLVAGYAKP